MKLYKYHFNNNQLSIREKISEINKLIAKHEQEIANPILDYISKREDFKLIGKSMIKNKNRAPTISFVVKNKSSKVVSDFLVKNKIATRNDNFYAWRCLQALKINTDDGVIRISLTHYNSEIESQKLIQLLDLI